jgi:plastocyanin
MKNIAKFARWLPVLGVLLISLTVLACSSSPSSSTPPNTGLSTKPTGTSTGSAGAVTIDISAKNTAFDTNKITVQAGAQVTINFTNDDAGVPHNIAFYTDKTASTPIYVGKTIQGVATTTYTFTAPTTPGTYFFRCDVHPSIMTGDFIVTPVTQ